MQQRHNPVQSATDRFALVQVHLQMEGMKEELRSAQDKLRRLQMQLIDKKEEDEALSLYNRARPLPVPEAWSLPHLPPSQQHSPRPRSPVQVACASLPHWLTPRLAFS